MTLSQDDYCKWFYPKLLTKVNKIHDGFESPMNEICETMGKSQGTVYSILHKKLSVKKSEQDMVAAFALGEYYTEMYNKIRSWSRSFLLKTTQVLPSHNCRQNGYTSTHQRKRKSWKSEF